MFLLSPAKLLVILVVALVVLGPDKLPKVAKQIGNLWGDLRALREKLENEVRTTFPDLPSTDTITQAVRSPLSFLDTLGTDEGASTGSPPDDGPTAAEAATSTPADERHVVRTGHDTGADLTHMN